MPEKYDLAEALKNHDKPLTKEQFENFDRYMAMTNDDKSADEVDIGPAIEARIREIDKLGTYWW
jgi:hypothetical protein